jgi:hypothetical protein
VIERLVTSLQQLARCSGESLDERSGMRLRGDCADAVRLELDCPQQSLGPEQRAALSRLSDVLEQGGAPTEQLAVAVRAACVALGLSAGEPRDRVT